MHRHLLKTAYVPTIVDDHLRTCVWVKLAKTTVSTLSTQMNATIL